MTEEWGASVWTMEDRYCINNCTIIAYVGLLKFKAKNSWTPFKEKHLLKDLELMKLRLFGGTINRFVLIEALRYHFNLTLNFKFS